MIVRYFKNKAENYKLPDRKAGRDINEEEYLTPEWCLKMLGSRHVIQHLILKPNKASCVATLQHSDYVIITDII